MKRIVIGIGVLLVGACGVIAAEDGCTAAVKATAEKAQPGAMIHSCRQIKEEGELLIEVKLTTKDGRAIVLDVAPDGTLLQSEEGVSVEALPREVLDALMSRYTGAKPTSAEKMVKAGGAVEYEVALNAGNGRKLEVTVTPSGDILEEEIVEE